MSSSRDFSTATCSRHATNRNHQRLRAGEREIAGSRRLNKTCGSSDNLQPDHCSPEESGLNKRGSPAGSLSRRRSLSGGDAPDIRCSSSSARSGHSPQQDETAHPAPGFLRILATEQSMVEQTISRVQLQMRRPDACPRSGQYSDDFLVPSGTSLGRSLGCRNEGLRGLPEASGFTTSEDPAGYT